MAVISFMAFLVFSFVDKETLSFDVHTFCVGEKTNSSVLGDQVHVATLVICEGFHTLKILCCIYNILLFNDLVVV